MPSCCYDIVREMTLSVTIHHSLMFCLKCLRHHYAQDTCVVPPRTFLIKPWKLYNMNRTVSLYARLSTSYNQFETAASKRNFPLPSNIDFGVFILIFVQKTKADILATWKISYDNRRIWHFYIIPNYVCVYDGIGGMVFFWLSSTHFLYQLY